jgi:hypothetical protein
MNGAYLLLLVILMVVGGAALFTWRNERHSSEFGPVLKREQALRELERMWDE